MRRVVVTGLGAITPVGKDINSFWDSLTAGRHGIAPITRFDTTDYKAKLAAEVKDFSPADYYTDKSEMRRTDLFAQYAMGAAVQAMADSGIEGKIDGTRLGVYVGSGIGGMSTFVSETLKLESRGPGRVSPFFIPMMISNMAAGTIAIRFGAKGPTLPVVTACATSSNTVGEAYRAVTHGYADAILAGGSEATVCPLAIAGFTNSMALCESSDPDRASIPFDAERCGFVMGEGAGMLLLEEYEHALARDAKIYAELVGYGNTCDAYHITAPHPEAEGAARAFALALEQAGITPDIFPAVAASLKREQETGAPAGAMVLPDGQVITGRTSDLLGASASLLLNALKRLGGINQSLDLISTQVLEPICKLKTQSLGHKNPRLHSDEVLIALCVSALTNPIAALAQEQIPKLKGCDAHFTVVLSDVDEKLYRRLGMHVSNEPKYERQRLYFK